MNADNLLDTIRGLEGLEIELFLAENQSIHGTLLSVQDDHLIVKADEKILYFPITQIKAISKNVNDSGLNNNGSKIATINRAKLDEILKTMYLQWITVNSFNNQSFSGVLSRVFNDYVLLINGDRQFFILKSQITNVLNEQVDENQIENLVSNAASNITFVPSDSNLSNTDNQLTEEQKKAIAETIKEKMKQLVPRANEEETTYQDSPEQTTVAQQEEQHEEQTNVTVQDENIEVITANDTFLHESPRNESENPQEIEIKSTTADEDMEKKQTATLAKKKKKHQKRPHFQEVKFNSPIQDCTWELTTMEADVPSDKNKETDELNPELKKTDIALTEDIAAIAEKEDFDIGIVSESLEETEQPADQVHEIQPVTGEIAVAAEQENAEENVEEILEPIVHAASGEETDFLHEPVKMLMEDNKRLLEYQYYALMKFAERMYHMENQYRAIMKHAEKMYLQLKERRYY